MVGVLLPAAPPHPPTARESNANRTAEFRRRDRLFHRFVLPALSPRPIAPARASPPIGSHGLRGPKGKFGSSMAVAAAVVTVNVLLAAALPDDVMLAGENAHAASEGKAPQENVTVPV